MYLAELQTHAGFKVRCTLTHAGTMVDARVVLTGASRQQGGLHARMPAQSKCWMLMQHPLTKPYLCASSICMQPLTASAMRTTDVGRPAAS